MQNQYLLDNYLVEVQLNLNNLTLTESQIENLCESISFDKLGKVNQFVTGRMEKILKSHKVNVSKIKTQSARLKNDLIKLYEDGKTPEQASKIMVKKASVIVKDAANKVIENAKDLDLSEKVMIGIIGFIIIIVINTAILGMLLRYAGIQAATYITTIIVAPMVEEATKAYFIDLGMPWVGTGIVFGIELGMYMFTLISLGANKVRALLVRLITLLVHFTTTFIQKKIVEKNEDDETAKIKAWAVGVGIHMSWNLFGMIGHPMFMKFLKIRI